MKPEGIFAVVNLVALLAWVTLVVRPRNPWVLRWAGQGVPLLFALAYAVIVVMRFGRVAGDFNSLTGVAALFSDPWILLAGWIHYLAFDLLIGVWEARDAAARQLSPWTLAPCLVFTFLFGPVGWLLYLTARTMPWTRRKPAAT